MLDIRHLLEPEFSVAPGDQRLVQVELSCWQVGAGPGRLSVKIATHFRL